MTKILAYIALVCSVWCCYKVARLWLGTPASTDPTPMTWQQTLAAVAMLCLPPLGVVISLVVLVRG